MIYVIGLIMLLLLIYILIIYNSIVKLQNNVKEAFATMDVYLKKRWDLIPNLVEVVKGYAKHEKETLTEIIELRKSAYDDMNISEKMKTNMNISNKINKLMALVENYPELKANENFLNLSEQLYKIEEDIANARKYYNGTVRDFNNRVELFPSNIIAKIFGYKSKEMFKTSEEEKENISIDFGDKDV